MVLLLLEPVLELILQYLNNNMFKKLKLITLILIKILYRNDLIDDTDKNTLKLISEKIKSATTEKSLNNILKAILLLEQRLLNNIETHLNMKLENKVIYEFIKKISVLTKNNKFIKKINKINEENISNDNKDLLSLFKDYTDFLEKYLGDINKQEIKYNEISEVLNSMFEIIAKLPKTNNDFKDKLFELKEKIEQTDDIKSIKKLKSTLMVMIDDIQIEISSFTKNINIVLEENLKYANLKIKALENKVDKVVKDSYTDALTGALNRKWFNENFNDFFWFEKNKNHLFVILDIDYFKMVNDTYGHKAGDIALKKVVKRFKNVLRGNREDKVIRYGGDEFIIVLVDVRENDVSSILNRLLESINSKVIKAGDDAMNLTISIGASMFTEADKPEKLFELTDKKLYISKENGRNRFTKDI